MRFFLKDPQSRLEYRLDWSDVYPSETGITASSWSVHPAGDNAINVEAESHDQLVSQVTISGGEAGRIYDLTNRITLDNGAVDMRSLTIRAEAR